MVPVALSFALFDWLAAPYLDDKAKDAVWPSTSRLGISYVPYSQSRPATAPGRPGHKLSPLPNEASKASISKEAGGEVWYGSDAVLTVRQLLLLLVRRGLVKGTPQHRKSPPPPEPVEPSQTSIKGERLFGVRFGRSSQPAADLRRETGQEEVEIHRARRRSRARVANLRPVDVYYGPFCYAVHVAS